MVEVSSPDGTRYCIDSTEVGWSAYSEFLKAKNGDMSGQPAGCEFNESYRDDDCVQSLPPTGSPVYCVDWCDAYMWCKWAGKELCGGSAWYNACSNGGTTVYPYGDTYDPAACVSEEHPTIDSFPQPLGETLTCQGIEPPFDAIFDMSGNVWEWVDQCGGGNCLVRGGGWATYMMTFDKESSCKESESTYRGSRNRSLGFRCCAPLIP
jgi:formylglycine-generating enzyme required for sulfatase activity